MTDQKGDWRTFKGPRPYPGVARSITVRVVAERGGLMLHSSNGLPDLYVISLAKSMWRLLICGDLRTARRAFNELLKSSVDWTRPTRQLRADRQAKALVESLRERVEG